MSAALKKKAIAIAEYLQANYDDATTSLDYSKPHELLVATILSAQCTDERVNIVTKDLFKKYRTVKAFADADLGELEKDIHSTGFFKNKAKNIKGCCAAIIEKHGGKVPGTMEELVELPGVGRKTANVVLGNAFGTPGVIVDTHVSRIAQRSGLSKNSDPVKIEFDIMELIPQKMWTDFSNQLVWHGRRICDARKPKCGECGMIKHCDFGKKNAARN
ncbi:MAG: Ultraviolet N-glycosylase/AP lyase [bacterium ADurb.Bin236]|nr:MAG: Ultraviolet N-glycosylase/AP lyase [bacterium ADurb.Bin236]HOY61922.1 endonuclease III [bacterium]HPN94602.1 endonuclease III [bacterium]